MVPTNSNDPAQPVVTLDAKGILEFVDGQNRREREYFDKLLRWFSLLVAVVVAVFGAVFGYFGYRNLQSVQEVQEDARRRMQAAVEAELAADKIQNQVSAAMQKITSQEFQKAIDRAVTENLDKPESRRLIADAIQRDLAKRMAPRVLTASQQAIIVHSLDAPLSGQLVIRSGSTQEQRDYARSLHATLMKSKWKTVSYLDPAAWDSMDGVVFDGVVVVVSDAKRPSDSARLLESTLKKAGVPNVRIDSTVGGPKGGDFWVFVGAKQY